MKDAIKKYEDGIKEQKSADKLQESRMNQIRREFLSSFLKWKEKNGFTYREISDELKISTQYLFDIMKARRGISEEFMDKLKEIV